MIDSLYIENFAIIDKLQIDFNSKMTVLTGETGAGKSIIIDAIGQLIGNRTQLGFIKKGRDKAILEGVFSVQNSSELKSLFDEYNIEFTDQIVISKSFNTDGKTVNKINYRTVPQMVIKAIMPLIVDIHSQFDTQELFNLKIHLEILDSYIGEELKVLKEQYILNYNQYRRLKKQYNDLVDQEMSDEQLDFYHTQLNEIDEIDIFNLDEDKLIDEKKRLQNFEKKAQHLELYKNIMTNNNGVIQMLKEALNELDVISDDKQYSQAYNNMYDLYDSINNNNEIILDIYRDNDYDENYFNEIQETFFTLNKLKRKYGQSLASIIDFRNNLEKKISNFNNRDQMLENLKFEIIKYEKQSVHFADKIHDLRVENANKFSKLVKKELADLYLSNVDFAFNFEKTSLTRNGYDDVVMMISTNIGQDLQPLNKVASGGELSRIMLAIKTICNKFSLVDTIIFDEADTGVSGKVAESIGKKMKNISKSKQVICITHLAQVASFADNHLLIIKSSDDDNTSVNLEVLNEKDSINEIAKMISGKDLTEESIKHASLLKKNNA